MAEQEINPFKPFNAEAVAKLAQGDLAIALLGKDNPVALEAQANAAELQALLIVKDKLLQPSIPDAKNRQDALFKSIKINPAEVFADINKEFPNQVTDKDIADARSEVDARTGLAEKYPAVPAYGTLLGRFLDKDLTKGILAVQTGLRTLTLLQDQTLDYPKANANLKFDSPLLFAVSQKLNALRDLRNTAQFPVSPEQHESYRIVAQDVIVEGLEQISKKYPEIADEFYGHLKPFLFNDKDREAALDALMRASILERLPEYATFQSSSPAASPQPSSSPQANAPAGPAKSAPNKSRILLNLLDQGEYIHDSKKHFTQHPLLGDVFHFYTPDKKRAFSVSDQGIHIIAINNDEVLKTSIKLAVQMYGGDFHIEKASPALQAQIKKLTEEMLAKGELTDHEGNVLKTVKFHGETLGNIAAPASLPPTQDIATSSTLSPGNGKTPAAVPPSLPTTSAAAAAAKTPSAPAKPTSLPTPIEPKSALAQRIPTKAHRPNFKGLDKGALSVEAQKELHKNAYDLLERQKKQKQQRMAASKNPAP